MSSIHQSAELGSSGALHIYPGDSSRRIAGRPSIVPNYSLNFLFAAEPHHHHPRPPVRPVTPLSDGTTPRNSVQGTHDIPAYKLPEDPEYREKGRGVGVTQCWWWWDIGAVLFSIVCLGLLAGVLVYADNTPLERWTASIQPNSAISILATLIKSAMLVPITSCLSQLKWRHMSIEPRPLSHLQVFDNASRGPWGSLTMMWKLPLQSKLGWALALVTVVALGIDPSTQQILDFEVQERVLENVTAKVGKAGAYYSKSLFEPEKDWESWYRSRDLPRFQASILSALSGNVFQPYSSCPSPATRCEWPDFSSLGICSAVRNVTQKTTRECKGGKQGASNCTYTIPLTIELPDGGRNTTISMNYINDTEKSDGNHILRTKFVHGEEDVVGQFVVVRHQNDSWSDDSSEPASPEVLVSDLRWCKKTYKNVTASVGSSGAGSESIDNELLSFVNRQIKDGRWGVTLTTPDEKENYTISNNLEAYLPVYLEQVLTVELEQQAARDDVSRLDLSKVLMKPSFLSTSTEVEEMMDDLSETLTNQLRTNDDGDNREATKVDGTAFFKEPVIVVRWGWFVLPALEVFFTIVLLFWVIIINGSVPLLKTSVMAYMVYPLSGWRNEEMVVEGQTGEKLDRLAEGMCGKMEESDGGYAIFKQQ